MLEDMTARQLMEWAAFFKLRNYDLERSPKQERAEQGRQPDYRALVASLKGYQARRSGHRR